MTLADWERRLRLHFEGLRRGRTASVGDKPIFALEHGLDIHELRDLAAEIRAHVAKARPSSEHSLPWIVYAAEIGYGYAGDEYWQTFEEDTPGWITHGERHWLRERFRSFHDQFVGARPSGAWANHFSIICWPITHAILPRDLQRQLARILYQLRHSFSADLFASPVALGELIAARSWEGTSRFQNLAQETALLGQIAAALLLEGEAGTAGLLLPETLRRIGSDLDRERSAREWLRTARHLAQERARFRGLSVPGGGTSAFPERAREDAAALGIEPRLVLRPKDVSGASWDVLLEIPDLSHLLLRLPSARAALVESRCVVAGASGRPLARRCFLHGAERVALGRWPRQDEVLLQFEQMSPQLEYLLRAECLLWPGPTWLFRVASDGLAYELRGLRVRPGQRYVILSTASPIPTGGASRPTTLSCEGVYAALVDVPMALSYENEAALKELGLDQAKTIHVWPAGLGAAAWDGEGRGEWLATEKPCIAIRSDHPLQSVVIALAPGESAPLELGALLPGDPVFIELPSLHLGAHTVRVRAHEESSGSQELLGELEVVVREPRPWAPGLSRQAPLFIQADPPTPTLEQLWDGRADLELYGPPRRSIVCTVSLFETSTETPSITKRLPPLELPVSPAAWRAHFEKHFCRVRDVQNARDAARACELEFSANELGAFKLRCEREFTPLRWAVRGDSHGQTIMLLDDSGAAAAVETRHYLFETPDREEQLLTAPLSRPVPVPAHGGMYVARQGAFVAAVITPPAVRTLTDLRCAPRLGDRTRSLERALHLVQIIGLWASARLTGNLFAASRQRDVLRALTRHLFLILGGEAWERAELAVRPSDTDLHELKRAVSTKFDEAGLAVALAAECRLLAAAPIRQRIGRLSSLAQKFLHLRLPEGTALPGPNGVRLIQRQIEDNSLHPDWLCELALRLASDPGSALSWAGSNSGPGLKLLFGTPALARAARFLVLSVEQQVQVQAIALDRLHAGWVWA
jgi:hypothetical protein